MGYTLWYISAMSVKVTCPEFYAMWWNPEQKTRLVEANQQLEGSHFMPNHGYVFPMASSDVSSCWSKSFSGQHRQTSCASPSTFSWIISNYCIIFSSLKRALMFLYILRTSDRREQILRVSGMSPRTSLILLESTGWICLGSCSELNARYPSYDILESS